MSALFRLPAARRMLFRIVSQIAVQYRADALSAGRAGGVHGGDRLPWVQPRPGEPDNFAPLASLRWQIHVYGAAAPGQARGCVARDLPLHVARFDSKSCSPAQGVPDGTQTSRLALFGGGRLRANSMLRAGVFLGETGRSGARVDLIVRTTLPRISPAVHARSIIGRFLEHARVAAFRRGGEWEVWCGSFDAMPRNFERRYELMFPVEAPRVKDSILRELRSQLRDDINCYELRADGVEEPHWGGCHDCQQLEARRRTRTHVVPPVRGLERGEPSSGCQHVGSRPWG